MESISVFVCCITWFDYRLVSERVPEYAYVVCCKSPKQALRVCVIRAIVCIALFDQRVDCRAAATQPLLRDAQRPTRTQPNKCVLPVSSAILQSTRGEFLLLTPSITHRSALDLLRRRQHIAALAMQPAQYPAQALYYIAVNSDVLQFLISKQLYYIWR